MSAAGLSGAARPQCSHFDSERPTRVLRFLAGYTTRVFCPRSPVLLYGRLLAACMVLDTSTAEMNSETVTSAVEWAGFRVVVVDDSADLDICYTIVEKFKADHPRFKDCVLYVAMAERAARGQRRVGEQFKPDSGLLSHKCNVGLDVLRAETKKLGCDDGVVSMMDEDDMTTATYHTTLLGACAAGVRNGNPIVTTMRPEELLMLVPRNGNTPARTVFVKVWSNMHSRHGCGAAMHYPLSMLGDCYVPLAKCAEDIHFMRLVHYRRGENQFRCNLVSEIVLVGSHYLERAFAGNWWASEHMKNVCIVLVEDQDARMAFWREHAPDFMAKNLEIARSKFVVHDAEGGDKHTHDQAGLLQDFLGSIELQATPPSAFELWDEKRDFYFHVASASQREYDAHCRPYAGGRRPFNPCVDRMPLTYDLGVRSLLASPDSDGLVLVAFSDASGEYVALRLWDARATRFDAYGLLDGLDGKYVNRRLTLAECEVLLHRVIDGKLALVDAAGDAVPWSAEEAWELLENLVDPPPDPLFLALQALPHNLECPFSPYKAPTLAAIFVVLFAAGSDGLHYKDIAAQMNARQLLNSTVTVDSFRGILGRYSGVVFRHIGHGTYALEKLATAPPLRLPAPAPHALTNDALAAALALAPKQLERCPYKPGELRWAIWMVLVHSAAPMTAAQIAAAIDEKRLFHQHVTRIRVGSDSGLNPSVNGHGERSYVCCWFEKDEASRPLRWSLASPDPPPPFMRVTREALEAAHELRVADVDFPGRPGEQAFAAFVALYRHACAVPMSIRQIVDAVVSDGLLDWGATPKEKYWDRLKTALQEFERLHSGEYIVKHGEGIGSTYQCAVYADADAAEAEQLVQSAPQPAAAPARRAKHRRVAAAEPAAADKRQRVDDAELQTGAADNLGAEARALIDFAKTMEARGFRGYGVENEAGRCGVVRISLGFTPGGLLRVHEFDCRCVPERRSNTHPLEVLSGCPFLPPCAPGWKRTPSGAFEWT